jgi:hypothetical protein
MSEPRSLDRVCGLSRSRIRFEVSWRRSASLSTGPPISVEISAFS